jgi:hypothetical protein
MPRRLTFALTDPQRICLGEALKHPPLPYVRERASALLKVAEGQSVPQVAQHGRSVPQVAQHGLLQRSLNTVCSKPVSPTLSTDGSSPTKRRGSSG